MGTMAYIKPTPETLKMRLAEFADVPDATVQYWLTDAERSVDETWIEVDYPVALILAAADGMARAGIGASAGDSDIPTGVTSLRSGNLSITRTAESASEGYAGDYTGTKYGRQFLALLRANKGGMRVTGAGVAPYEGFGYLSGLHPSW
jgi:hypothetical protein